MSTTVTPKPGKQLWGIYHTDREQARELGDPLRTTIEAPTKVAAEEEAAKLGFGDPWAHPIATEVVTLARTILKKYPSHRRELTHKSSRGIHV
ncbi:MAG: hypothetical protein U1F83_10485 [Verrucomicrobiota bacterium]